MSMKLEKRQSKLHRARIIGNYYPQAKCLHYVQSFDPWFRALLLFYAAGMIAGTYRGVLEMYSKICIEMLNAALKQIAERKTELTYGGQMIYYEMT